MPTCFFSQYSTISKSMFPNNSRASMPGWLVAVVVGCIVSGLLTGCTTDGQPVDQTEPTTETASQETEPNRTTSEPSADHASDEKDEPQTNGKYKPTWASLKNHPTPEWFDDAKLGIFVHWGVYSVPGYKTEWYPRLMYREGDRFYDEGKTIYQYHRNTYGPQSEFGYKAFIPKFKAKKWDPDRWAKLFGEVGAGYVLMPAEHHDGFAMWDSDLTDWNAVERGPERDIIGDLADAVRKRGMKFAPTYHRGYHWYYYNHKDKYDTGDPAYSGLYGASHPDCDPLSEEDHPCDPPSEEWLKTWRNRWFEIMDKYKPDMMWLDFGWGTHKAYFPYAKEMMARFYNAEEKWGKDVVVNNKTIAEVIKPGIPEDVGDYVSSDHRDEPEITERKWAKPTTLAGDHSWGYNRIAKPEDFKTVNSLVDMIVDVVSKNGNVMLNVGPKSSGVIPEIQKERLRGVGEWLDVNGEAIFGTDYWKTFGTDNIRFTRTGDRVLYVTVLEWPGDQVLVEPLSDWTAEDVSSVRMLGSDEDLSWSFGNRGLTLKTPSEKPCKHAFVFKIQRSTK